MGERRGQPPGLGALSPLALGSVVGVRCQSSQRALNEHLSLGPATSPQAPKVPILCPVEDVPPILGALPHLGSRLRYVIRGPWLGAECPSPLLSPGPLSPSADHVSVSVELRFGTVPIAKAPLSFYDCVAVAGLHPSAQ